MNEGLYNYHNHNYHEKTARLSPVVRVQIKPFLSFFLKWDSSHASLLIPSLPLTKSEPGVGGKATVETARKCGQDTETHQCNMCRSRRSALLTLHDTGCSKSFRQISLKNVVEEIVVWR